MANIKREYSYKWTNGTLEFDTDLEVAEYYDTNGLPAEGVEFVRVDKIKLSLAETAE